MESRGNILRKLQAAQREFHPLPSSSVPLVRYENSVDEFKQRLSAVGGVAVEIARIEEIADYISNESPHAGKVVTTLFHSDHPDSGYPHSLADAGIAVLKGQFGVAENGAVWLTEKNMIDRALPFICENLMLVIERKNILNNLHEAYDQIANDDYQYGTFISGPSKTADIEQSLVLGAHGAKRLVVFIIN